MDLFYELKNGDNNLKAKEISDLIREVDLTLD